MVAAAVCCPEADRLAKIEVKKKVREDKGERAKY